MFYNVYILYVNAISCKGFAIVAAKNKIIKDDLIKIELLNYCIFKRKHKKDNIPIIIKDCVINKKY